MSNQYIKVFVPPAVAVPRGALWAAAAVAWAVRVLFRRGAKLRP